MQLREEEQVDGEKYAVRRFSVKVRGWGGQQQQRPHNISGCVADLEAMVHVNLMVNTLKRTNC
jgi:hypothetical protein